MFNRLFQRKFGIAVRKVGVRNEIAWHWRILIWVGVIALALAFADKLYDAGRRFAGFERESSEQKLAEAKARIVVLNSQLARAQEELSAGVVRLTVESSSVAQLALQLKGVQAENLALKEELALFEGLVSAAGVPTGSPVRIARAAIERLAPGRYRYRLVLVHQVGQKNSKEFSGEFGFELKVRTGGRDAMMNFPASGASASQEFRLSFRQIHRVEGDLLLAPGSEVIDGSLFISQGGSVVVRHPLKL
jgi:hypothetical protein